MLLQNRGSRGRFGFVHATAAAEDFGTCKVRLAPNCLEFGGGHGHFVRHYGAKQHHGVVLGGHSSQSFLGPSLAMCIMILIRLNSFHQS